MPEEEINTTQDITVAESEQSLVIDKAIQEIIDNEYKLTSDTVPIGVTQAKDFSDPNFSQGYQLENIYQIPQRDWEYLINLFNTVNLSLKKKKFPFTPLECSAVIYNIAQGQFPARVFQAFGISSQKYNIYKSQAEQLENKLSQYDEKESLTEEDEKIYTLLQFNALRVLFNDIERAEAVAHIVDINDLNRMGKTDGNVLIQKVRTKYKEFKGDDKESTGGTMNVRIIKVGGDDWIEKMRNG